MWLWFSSQERPQRQEQTRRLERPIEFTQPDLLNNTLTLVRTKTLVSAKWELAKPQTSDVVARITIYDDPSVDIKLSDKRFQMFKPFPFSNKWVAEGSVECEAYRIILSSDRIVRYQAKEFRLIRTDFWNRNFVVCVVKENGAVVNNRKVMEIMKDDWVGKKFTMKFTDEVSDEFVACIASLVAVPRYIEGL